VVKKNSGDPFLRGAWPGNIFRHSTAAGKISWETASPEQCFDAFFFFLLI